MKVMGFDPGVTTGVCVCLYKKVPFGEFNFSLTATHHEEIVFSDKFFDEIRQAMAIYRPQLVVMESVVQSGHLSREKVVQIRAHDRVLTAAAIREVKLKEVHPQAVKRITEVPRGIKGNHARDAFRIVMAHFAGL